MSEPRPSSTNSGPAFRARPSAIWVLAETRGGHLETATLELLGDARKLAATLDTAAQVVLLCDERQSRRILDELRPYEPSQVYLLEHDALATYTTDGYLQALEPLVGSEAPFLMMIPATANGRDLAPRLAARCRMGYLPHALVLKPLGKENVEVTRVTHGGGVHCQSDWPVAQPLVVTLKPGVADAQAPNAKASDIPVVRHKPVISEGRIRVRVLEQIPPDPRIQDIREAERIVSGGRGVGSREGFAVVQDLANSLNAAVAASRVVVDLGWAPYDRQVGQTGKTVAPRLYIAVGISGASHHLMGMRGSEKIVAVNNDRKAPIFSIAHFGVVGDLHAVLPTLARRIRQGHKGETKCLGPQLR